MTLRELLKSVQPQDWKSLDLSVLVRPPSERKLSLEQIDTLVTNSLAKAFAKQRQKGTEKSATS
jgi:hypothetical protein